MIAILDTKGRPIPVHDKSKLLDESLIMQPLASRINVDNELGIRAQSIHVTTSAITNYIITTNNYQLLIICRFKCISINQIVLINYMNTIIWYFLPVGVYCGDTVVKK